MELFHLLRPCGCGRGIRRAARMVPVLGLTAALTLTAAGCAVPGGAGEDENEKFEQYTAELFRREISSDTVSLHYTLMEPEMYGVEESEPTFGSAAQDPEEIRASAENMRQALLTFDYDKLDVQNQVTYDVLNERQKTAEKMAGFLLYGEPLGTVGGVQTQLPVVLSEYRFYGREDADTYLQLLETTGGYFDSILEFEREKAEAGLFMSDDLLDTVLEQCRAFLEMGDGNYLYSTFADRIGELDKLTEKEKSDYIQDNAAAVRDCVLPAYESLVSGLEALRGSGKNTGGLVFLPEGAEYYELLVRESVGTSRSVEELEDLTRRQITDDLEAMEQVLGITAGEAEAAAAEIGGENATLILSHLKKGIEAAFPEAPGTELKVKYVPEEMEAHLSPAFYMIPAIDNAQENVIYINRSQMGDELTLFTTLAHEGYPGHLYQNLYYESTGPDPVRSLFSFGGYTEGWATYAEMGSYYLTPLSKEQALLLQKNASVILALYALADMGIHYEGWDRMDTAEFFKNYGIADGETVERIYELILGSPANYLKYYIGYVEFLELKKEWIEEKGEDFSQKEFHEAVLKVGPAPFAVVEEHMWEMTGEGG